MESPSEEEPRMVLGKEEEVHNDGDAVLQIDTTTTTTVEVPSSISAAEPKSLSEETPIVSPLPTPTVSNLSASHSPSRQQQQQQQQLQDAAIEEDTELLLGDLEEPHPALVNATTSESKKMSFRPRRLPSMGDTQPTTPSKTSHCKPRLLSAKKSSSVNWNSRKGSTLVSPRPEDAPRSDRTGSAAPPVSTHDTGTQEPLQTAVTTTVAVFNANTKEGGSMVRALSKSGQNVIAVVRVFTSKNTKRLLKLPHTSVKVADSHDEAALTHAIAGAHRAFLVTKYWESFDSWLEESQANIIVRACGTAGVSHLVLSSVEDTKLLKERGYKSQIVPNPDGVIHPKFEGMRNLRQDAKERGVLLTHMLTSYVDQEHSKKSVALIMSERGRLVVSES